MHTQTRGKCHEKQAKRSVTFAVSFRYCILASEPSPLHLIDLKSKFIEQHTGCDQRSRITGYEPPNTMQ